MRNVISDCDIYLVGPKLKNPVANYRLFNPARASRMANTINTIEPGAGPETVKELFDLSSTSSRIVVINTPATDGLVNNYRNRGCFVIGDINDPVWLYGLYSSHLHEPACNYVHKAMLACDRLTFPSYRLAREFLSNYVNRSEYDSIMARIRIVPDVLAPVFHDKEPYSGNPRQWISVLEETGDSYEAEINNRIFCVATAKMPLHRLNMIPHYRWINILEDVAKGLVGIVKCSSTPRGRWRTIPEAKEYLLRGIPVLVSKTDEAKDLQHEAGSDFVQLVEDDNDEEAVQNWTTALQNPQVKFPDAAQCRRYYNLWTSESATIRKTVQEAWR